MYVMVYMGSGGGGYYVPFAFAEALLNLPKDPELEEGYPSLLRQGGTLNTQGLTFMEVIRKAMSDGTPEGPTIEELTRRAFGA